VASLASGGNALASLATGDRGASLVVRFAFPLGGAFVPFLLALCQCDLAFRSPLAKVEAGRNEGEALLPRSDLQLSQLTLMQQELAGAEGVMVHRISMREGSNVGIQQKDLTVLQQPVGVFQVGFTFANGFDFGSAEGNTGLVSVEQRIVMAGCAIVRGVAQARGDRIAVLLPHGGFGGRSGSRIGE